MVGLRASALLILAVGAGVVSYPAWSRAEWWKLYAPKDFEDCSTSAEQPGLSHDAKAQIISDCDARFSGRRKPGGGYTYFDFQQDRHFDIAGPNPTQAELKQIDEAYLLYLDERRQKAIVAAFAQKPQLPELFDQLSAPVKPPLVIKPRPVTTAARVRKDKVCTDILSCGWKKLTKGVQDLQHSLVRTRDKQDAYAQR